MAWSSVAIVLKSLYACVRGAEYAFVKLSLNAWRTCAVVSKVFKKASNESGTRS